MNPIIPEFVDINQFAVPNIFPASVRTRRVIAGVGQTRDVPVLEIVTPTGVSFFFSVGQRILHQSSNSTVLLGIELLTTLNSDALMATTRPVVIKISNLLSVRNNRMLGHTAENPVHEVAAHMLIGNRHPNIVSVVLAGASDDSNLYVVMDYPLPVQGFPQPTQLHTYLETFGRFTYDGAKLVFRDIMEGVRAVHSSGLAHRDLGLANIVVNVTDPAGTVGSARILDFGLVHRITNPQFPPPPMYGTYVYCYPPEILFSNQHRDTSYTMDPRAFDIWACGCILFLLVAGVPLFEIASPADPNFARLMNDPHHGLNQILTEYRIDEGLKRLLCSILRLNPLERPTADTILAHPWMQG